MQKQVVVVPYNPEWPEQFDSLRALIWPAVQDFALRIEHVGSTSVPGLAAKPAIDMDIVIPDMTFLPRAIAQLAKLGYEHRGNMGIADREAFRRPDSEIKHHLYVCPQDSLALRNHLYLRDTLRGDPALRDAYGALKFALAARFPDSIDDYIEGKTDFILEILARNGLGADRLGQIRSANLAPKNKSSV